MYSAIENTPIVVNLLTACNDTGWTVDGVNATHVSCNSGLCTLVSYPVIANHSYQVSWIMLNCSSGYCQLQTPGSNGAQQTTANVFVENVTPTSNGFVQFFSNANCVITGFNISDRTITTGTTIVWGATNKKWSDFRTMYPDYGWSIDTQTILAYQGNLYKQDNVATGTFNYFFGNQFQTTVQVVGNSQPTEIKKFKSISYQSNELWVTTSDGITTSSVSYTHLTLPTNREV